MALLLRTYPKGLFGWRPTRFICTQPRCLVGPWTFTRLVANTNDYKFTTPDIDLAVELRRDEQQLSAEDQIHYDRKEHVPYNLVLASEPMTYW